MSVRIAGQSRAVAVRPGAVFGNQFGDAVQTVTVTYTDAWTLLFEHGSRSFSGAGSVTVEVDADCAWAIRNDGAADVYVIAPEGHTRVIAEPVTRIAGVDGCRHGWVAVVKDGDAIEARVCTNDAELLALFASCAVVAIDVPIGLVEQGQRVCDHHARKFLKNKSSVFTAPIRPILNAKTPVEAQAIARGVQNGRGLPYTTVALRKPVAQIDGILRRHRELRSRIYEVHPEISFLRWNEGHPLGPKRSQAGRAARRALVSARYGEIPAVPRGAREDDLLDAFAALWTAERVLAGESQALGDAHEDATGLPMRIVY